MHSTALVSFLLALPCTRAVVWSCLNGVNIEVGEKCFMESDQYCDANCTQRITCTNGTYQLMETCKPKACEWYRDTGTTECLSEPETAEPLIPGVHDLGLDFDAGCGPMITIGAQCATYTEREGEMRCDTTCGNIGICHNGVFQMNSPCAPGRCQWNAETGQPFCV
ncbi:hypothetical protein F5883DRAFT_534979 [Diaporthe sp. PMI_573]|nr:hypothetical protein F5883DRAFT_534979 [Diaporthaceae sp. PMI_573]